MLNRLASGCYRFLLGLSGLAMIGTFVAIMLNILARIFGWNLPGLDGYAGYAIAATLFLALWARLRGRTDVTAFGRSIPPDTVARAAGLAVGGLVLVGAMVFLLMVTEAPVAGYRDRTHFLDVVFEAHSAFGTVGLSTGVTSGITPAGRVVLSFLMFAGRVGPAALVAAMITAAGRRRIPYRMAREDVMIG